MDFSELEVVPPEVPPGSFTGSPGPHAAKLPTWQTRTTSRTHRLILENLHLSPLYAGDIVGIGPRYCPSIEDKVVRFSDKDSHLLFVEPDGLATSEVYLQGFSSSLPPELQEYRERVQEALESLREPLQRVRELAEQLKQGRGLLVSALREKGREAVRAFSPDLQDYLRDWREVSGELRQVVSGIRNYRYLKMQVLRAVRSGDAQRHGAIHRPCLSRQAHVRSGCSHCHCQRVSSRSDSQGQQLLRRAHVECQRVHLSGLRVVLRLPIPHGAT